MSVKALNWRPYTKNTLRGFCDLILTNVGLQINGCTLHEKKGRRWVGIPAKPYTDDDGKKQWQPIVQLEKSARESFRKQAVAAVERVIK